MQKLIQLLASPADHLPRCLKLLLLPVMVTLVVLFLLNMDNSGNTRFLYAGF